MFDCYINGPRFAGRNSIVYGKTKLSIVVVSTNGAMNFGLLFVPIGMPLKPGPSSILFQ